MRTPMVFLGGIYMVVENGYKHVCASYERESRYTQPCLRYAPLEAVPVFALEAVPVFALEPVSIFRFSGHNRKQG